MQCLSFIAWLMQKAQLKAQTPSTNRRHFELFTQTDPTYRRKAHKQGTVDAITMPYIVEIKQITYDNMFIFCTGHDECSELNADVTEVKKKNLNVKKKYLLLFLLCKTKALAAKAC